MSDKTKKINFTAWLEQNQLTTPNSIYQYFFADIQAVAAQVDIDLQRDDLSMERSGKYSSSAHHRFKMLNKTPPDKVVVYVELKEKKGVTTPFFSFFTQKDGGYSETFSTYNALWNEYKAGQPIDAGRSAVKPRAPRSDSASAAKKEQQSNRWRQSQTLLWQEQHREGLVDLSGSGYLQRKFGDAVDAVALLASASGVRFGMDAALGNFVIFPFRNAKGDVVGYQKIYDQNLPNKTTNKDYRFLLQGTKNGSFFKLGAGEKYDDYVFIGEGLSTNLTAHYLAGKTCFVAGDAANLIHVLAAVKAMGYKRPVLLADNDVSDKGNTGVFAVLKAAKMHGARIFVANNGGGKCDFNDVMMQSNDKISSFYSSIFALSLYTVMQSTAEKKQFDSEDNGFDLLTEFIELAWQDFPRVSGADIARSQLVFRNNPVELFINPNVFGGALQLLEVCPSNQLKKHIWIACANAVSNQLEMDLRDAEQVICAVLTARQAGSETLEDDIHRVMGKALSYALKKCKQRNQINFDDFDRVIDCSATTNEAIAAELLDMKNVIALNNGAMATGKTEQIGVINRLALSRGKVTTYGCHRTSLVASAAPRIGATGYKDNANMEFVNALALCANSFINPRYVAHVTQFSNVLFLDEIRQTVEHVAIGSIKSSERKLVHDALIAAINNADLVLGSDADLNQLTVDWIKHHFPQKRFVGLTNKFTPPTAIIEYGYYEPAFNRAVATALNAAERKEPTLIQCDSINAANAAFQAVNRPHLRVLLVHSKNKADPAQAKFLANPDIEIRNYDVVIHSPVIGSGVSITCDHIKHHFALFRGVLPENEVLQMVGRNRASKLIVVGFNAKHLKNRVTSAKTLLDGETTARMRVVDGEVHIDALDKLRMKVTARTNESLNDVANQALLLMRLKGYQLRRFDDDQSIDSIVEARQAAKAVHCEGVLSATDISALDAYKLEKADAITQAESYQLERYQIQHEFALSSISSGDDTLPSIDEDAVAFFDGGRIIKTLHNREIAEATTAQREAVDKKVVNGFKSVAKGHHIDVLLMLMQGKTMQQSSAVVVLDYLNKHHAELAALGLGNYAKSSKYPIRVVNDFLSHFGYKLLGKKISSGVRKGDRVYTLKTDERIDEIVNRRTLQNPFKALSGSSVADAV